MPLNKLNIADFLEKSARCPLLDVRSPGEFEQGHIPGAHNLALFSNEERAVVGTAYKKQSRETAIKTGLEYFGKNLVKLVETAENISEKAPVGNKELLVHCWRGGMRSAAVAWLLDLYGFKINLLTGGYKTFRRYAIDQFENNHHLLILGGYTGSNKTALLKLLPAAVPFIDLEAIAGHKGSAFGNLDNIPQPSQEHFENLLAMELLRCGGIKQQGAIWLEGESQRLGNINIPLSFSKNMKRSKMIFLEIPFEARLELITKDYGNYPKEKLVNAILRIKKRLGGLETRNAVNYLLEDDLKSCFAVLLKYYDKFYLRTIRDNEYKEREIINLQSDTTNAAENLKKLKAYGFFN